MRFSSYILIVLNVALFPALEARLDECFNVEGLLVPPYTPVDDKGNIALNVIGQYAQYLYSHGIRSVVVATTMGEGPSLNISDHKKLLDAWMKAAKPLEMLVISSVGATPMPYTLEMSRYSEEVGVDGLLAMPDIFFKPKTAEELVYYMKLISEAAPETPLVYDDVPEYTGVDEVNMEEFFELAKEKISTFRGIKSNVFENLLELRDKVEEPLKLYASEHIYLAAEVFMGFKNFVMADANLFPQLFFDIINSGQSGNLERATALYQRLVDLLDAIIKNKSNEIAALKEAMPLITGIEVGPALPPILPLTEEEKEDIKQALIANNITIVTTNGHYYY